MEARVQHMNILNASKVFLPQEGIEFIYYDQLGCGNSDNPKDTTHVGSSKVCRRSGTGSFGIESYKR